MIKYLNNILFSIKSWLSKSDKKPVVILNPVRYLSTLDPLTSRFRTSLNGNKVLSPPSHVPCKTSTINKSGE